MNIKLILKGFIIGIAKIIPGVSGGLLAISLGVYDKLIESITTFFYDKKNNFIFLTNISIGAILGILLFSKIIIYLLNNYYLYTIIFFTSLVFGGILPIYKDINKNKTNVTLILISFIMMLSISIFTIDNNYTLNNNILDILMISLSGILESIGTIIPGISATALLLYIGTYDIIMTAISQINLSILIPFLISLCISTIILLKSTNYIIKKYYQQTYSIILGISFGTIFTLFLKIIKLINLNNILISIILFIIGIYISNKFDN